MFSKSTIKYIQSLQHKKFRDEYGVFPAEGPKVVGELLSAGKFNCRAIYATEEWIQGLDITLASSLTGKLHCIQDFELEKIASFSTANKVVAVFEKTEPVDFDPSGQLSIMLDDIQDPGNLGTIIRTADWFGVKNIICSTATVDAYNPKVVQSTMASLGRVNVLPISLQSWLHEHPLIPVYAAMIHGSPIASVGKIKEAVVLIGNESKGVSKELLPFCKNSISIPKIGDAESLNAAVATGIILYALSGN